MPALSVENSSHSENLHEACEAIKRVSLFSLLAPEVVETLAEASERRFFSKGETIFTMNQYDGADVYCIVDGKAKLTTVTQDADALSVEELAPGDIFGIEFVLGSFTENVLQASLTAVSSLSLLTIDSVSILELVKRKPIVARALLSGFARNILQLKTGPNSRELDPQKRLYRTLFDIVERDDTQIPSRWRIPKMPKHRDLGENAGTTEIEAAEAVARLISEGIAKREYPGLLILNYSAFHSLAL